MMQVFVCFCVIVSENKFSAKYFCTSGRGKFNFEMYAGAVDDNN